MVSAMCVVNSTILFDVIRSSLLLSAHPTVLVSTKLTWKVWWLVRL